MALPCIEGPVTAGKGPFVGGVIEVLVDKHRIINTYIGHPEFTGLRITPNVYTTPDEIDLFAEKVLEAIKTGVA